MNEPEQHDFSTRVGVAMAAGGFVMMLFLLTMFFERSQERRRNPNRLAVAIVHEGAQVLELQANRDGHYVISGLLNGEEAVYILDTGATTVAVPESLAVSAGLKKGAEISVSTANGRAKAWMTSIDTIEIGGFRMNAVTATINPGLYGNEVLLGMNVLGAFDLRHSNGTLRMERAAVPVP